MPELFDTYPSVPSRPFQIHPLTVARSAGFVYSWRLPSQDRDLPMPRFAANLSMLYPEHDFLERFSAAAADGFEAVEYLFPYDHSPQVLKQRLDDNGLVQILFNTPPGDWAAGERGTASLPGREQE